MSVPSFAMRFLLFSSAGYIFGVARTTDSKKENVFLLHTMGAQV